MNRTSMHSSFQAIAQPAAPWRQRLAALPRDARDTLFLLAVVAWVLMPQAAHTPWWTMVFVAGLLLWRGLLAWRGQPLPGRWVLGGLLLLAVGATWVSHGTFIGRDAGVTLIVLLLALKTLELRARRDAMVVFFLGFFALLANFFYSQSLLLALAMVLGLLGLLTALVNAHMTAGRPPLTQALRTAALLALWGTPVMVALFLFFPRMAPLWGVPSNDLAGRSGLSENMRVGSMASLVLDENVALRLRFDTPDGAPPPANTLYFRGPVLSRFDGQEWQMDTEAVLEDAQLRVSGEGVSYQMTIEPSRRPWLPLLDAAARAPELPPGMGSARMTPQLQWLTWRPITDVVRISAQSHVQFSYGPLQPTRALRRYTQLPEGSNPRTLELARQMRADPQLAEAPPRAWVQAALARLRTGGYTYTLEPGVVDSVHTADDFWFDSKEGFCEHIASAFAVLMRGMGVPARIVTGYQGGERNPVDGYWTVRNADAHAWTEVWLADEGWVRIDPTGAVAPSRVGEFQRLRAPQGAIAGAVGNFVGVGMLQQMRAVWEAVNNGWNQWVLNYTQSRQLDLLKNLGVQSPSWVDMLRLLGALAGVAALAWLAWMARAQRSSRDEWLRLMDKTRARLRRIGLDADASLPPRALAAQVMDRWGQDDATAAKALHDWLLDMERQRYARAPQSVPRSAPQSAPNSAPDTPGLPALRRQWRALDWPRTPQPRPQAAAAGPTTSTP
jgi:transglutaminase-like putative cysteine protease